MTSLSSKTIGKERLLRGKDKRTFEETKQARILLVYIGLVLFFLLFALRAIKYQVIDRDVIKNQVESQLSRKIPVKAMRGQILDRNGKVLAFSRETYDIELVKGEEDEELLKKISEVYSKTSVKELEERIAAADKKYVTILEDVPVDFAHSIGKVDPSRIGVIKRFKRVYPNGELAAKILGTLSSDGFGVAGVEREYNEKLAGIDGYIETETDLLGRRNPFAEVTEVKAKDGEDIRLTIDSAIQHSVFNIVKKKREELQAKEVIGIVQDAKSGEILAMSSTYSFDPNRPQEIIDERLLEEYEAAESDEKRSEILLKMWSDPIVSTNYEPGSIMKIVTSVVAIEENLVSANSSFYCGGMMLVDGEPVKCQKFPDSHGALDFKYGFMYSCNVVYTELLKRIDKDTFYRYLENMGLLDRMDIGLTTIGQPIYIKKDELYNIDYAKMSFGHAIALTPIHVANIVFSISNDGMLVQPSLIKKIGDKEVPKKTIGMVCTKETTDLIRDFMKATAELSPQFHCVPGFSSGVKTGTSVKFVDGKYDSNTVCTSVVHITPIEDPKINVIAIVDEPKTSIFSSVTAGSVARDISEECLRYLKVSPDMESKDVFKKVPDFTGLTFAEAEALAASKNIQIKVDETRENNISPALRIIDQSPEAGSLIAEDTLVFVLPEVEVLEGKNEQ